jgi:hypothetical protein
MDLNHARLPIPPLRQVKYLAVRLGRLEGRYCGIYSYKAWTECQTWGLGIAVTIALAKNKFEHEGSEDV